MSQNYNDQFGQIDSIGEIDSEMQGPTSSCKGRGNGWRRGQDGEGKSTSSTTENPDGNIIY